MIYDFDQTLEKLIYRLGKLNKSDIDIAFEQPTSEWAATLSRPTINCWLFDLRENTKLRSMEMVIEREEMPGGRGRRRLVPKRFDLSYLVTVWTRRIEDEHQLLWRVLAGLCAQTSLDPDMCEGAVQRQPFQIPLEVAQNGELAPSMTDLWSVLANELRPGFTVTATLALDPEIYEPEDYPFVMEGRVEIGQSRRPDRFKGNIDRADDETGYQSKLDAPDDVDLRLRGKRQTDEEDDIQR